MDKMKYSSKIRIANVSAIVGFVLFISVIFAGFNLSLTSFGLVALATVSVISFFWCCLENYHH